MLTYKTNAIKKIQTHTCSQVTYRHTNTQKKEKKRQTIYFLKTHLEKIELKTWVPYFLSFICSIEGWGLYQSQGVNPQGWEGATTYNK